MCQVALNPDTSHYPVYIGPYPILDDNVKEMSAILEERVPMIEHVIAEYPKLPEHREVLDAWMKNVVGDLRHSNSEACLERLLECSDDRVPKYNFPNKAAVSAMLARVRAIFAWTPTDSSLPASP